MESKKINKKFVILMTLLSLIGIINFRGFVLANEDSGSKAKITLNRKMTYDSETKLTTLEGEVTVATDDMVIRSDKFLANMETSDGKTTVHNMYTEEEFSLERNDGVNAKGDTIYIDFESETVDIIGNGKLEKRQVLESRDDEGNYEEELAIICADNIHIYMDKEDFTAAGKVNVTRGDQSAECDKAYYRSEENALDMEGSVYIIGAGGETIKADKATIYLDSESFTAEAKEGGEIEITLTIN